MLGTIIRKELKSYISSPKFVVTFLVCTLLILLSVWVGIMDYRTSVTRYEAALQLNDMSLQEQTWDNLGTRAYRQPDPMQIFVSGVHNDIGRFSGIQERQEIKLRNSMYSDSTIFALFRFVDFEFIVLMVLSLFAILFTYDAINGERESGTLQLTFANPVPRARFILGKLVGSWLGLVIPLLIPILLAILLVLLMRVPMTPLHWQKLVGLAAVSLLFFTFFSALGLRVSALTRRSATSFLVLLVLWVVLVFIVPRAGVMAAGQLVEVPSVAEIQSRKEGFAREQQRLNMEEMMERSRNFPKKMEGMTAAERNDYMKRAMDDLRKESDESRKKMDEEIAEYSRKLNEERRNRQARLERLAFTLSRFSPASAFSLAAMNLAETDIALKSRAEDAMTDYKSEVVDLAAEKAAAGGSGTPEVFRFEAGSGNAKVMFGISFGGSNSPTLDPAEVPVFASQPRSFSKIAAGTLVDVGLIALYALLAFAGAFVGFLRYDVR
jgi:ABC-type transport system involved in multi-copper enzyme maturation permease subunit